MRVGGGGGQVQKVHFLRLLVDLFHDITKVQVPRIIVSVVFDAGPALFN